MERWYRLTAYWHFFLMGLICRWLGRHDYEFAYPVFDKRGVVKGAVLSCFYCTQKKESRVDV